MIRKRCNSKAIAQRRAVFARGNILVPISRCLEMNSLRKSAAQRPPYQIFLCTSPQYVSLIGR